MPEKKNKKISEIGSSLTACLSTQKMIVHIDKKRKALGLDKSRERVLMDMEMRRELDAV